MKCTIDLSLLSTQISLNELQVLSRFVNESNYRYTLPKDLEDKQEVIILLPVDRDGISNWGHTEQVKRFKAYYSSENIVSIELVE